MGAWKHLELQFVVAHNAEYRTELDAGMNVREVRGLIQCQRSTGGLEAEIQDSPHDSLRVPHIGVVLDEDLPHAVHPDEKCDCVDA